MWEIALREALIAHLAADPALAGELNTVVEEAPLRTAPPWLAVVASASADWSTKSETGREVRVALELHMRGDDPGAGRTLAGDICAAVEALPSARGDFRIANTRFLRARVEQRPENRRAMLIEYRFRLIES